MSKIKKALISLSDKQNLKPLLNCLKKYNIQIISSGGTFKAIKKLKFKCIEVSDFTNSPEILDGRVKTLHPKIHAGILNKRKNKRHKQELKKNIIFEKNYWKINCAHDGFLKKYNIIHEREIEFYPDNSKLIGVDKIIGKKKLPNLIFDIRFHLDPLSKVMKTQDNKTILIEIGDEGWKFNCNNYEVNIENGLFFNSKSTYVENQNIFISGIINSKNSDIKWELIKI